MTIKQLGGVFGRNPTFNDVTIEGELTFDGDIDIKSDLKIDGDLEVTGTSKLTGNVGIGKSSGSNALEVQGESLFGSGTDGIKLTYSGGNSTGIIDTGYTSTGLEFRVGNVKKLTLNSSGNLEMNSGSGIDFSATAGTGTSELLDDYEEGVWTPTYLGSTGNPTITYDMQYGIYVKVGRLCQAICRIRTDATSGGSGNLQLGGLPFAAFSAVTSSMSGGITVNRANDFTTNTPTYGVITGGNSHIDLNYNIAANSVTTANLTNAVNSNTLIISLVYQTA